jgi:chlorobactene glucosyltransferase
MSPTPQGRVSAIIPARNEEANIARVVRSLANQEDLREIVVVDDQSMDRTGETLVTLEREVPLLRIMRVESIPDGWLGKTHALAQGVRGATGEWLLFTDADTEHLAGSLAGLLQRAEAEGADLLSVSPGQETPTWWEKSVIPLVYVKLASLYRFEDVSNPNSPAAAANGQYLLVRRDVYERSGGHEAVKQEILDDVELARRIKARGGKLVFLPGAQWVRTRMYREFGQMWHGWRKNLYLLYEANGGKMLAEVASLWFMDLFPVLALFAAGLWINMVPGSAAALLLVIGLFVLAWGRRRSYERALAQLGFDPSMASYLSIGAALLGALLLSSLRAYRAGGSIEWKGRHYATKGKE